MGFNPSLVSEGTEECSQEAGLAGRAIFFLARRLIDGVVKHQNRFRR
jgi:hypothetical protein